MKIIDLLNKIANGENIKNIKYQNHIYEYYNGDYREEIDGAYDSNWLFANEIIDLSNLNEEVEIIEEDEIQPEDVLSFTLTDKVWTPRQARELIENFRKISEKLKRKKDNNKIEEINNAYYHETQDRINEIFKNKINDIIDKINNME